MRYLGISQQKRASPRADDFSTFNRSIPEEPPIETFEQKRLLGSTVAGLTSAVVGELLLAGLLIITDRIQLDGQTLASLAELVRKWPAEPVHHLRIELRHVAHQMRLMKELLDRRHALFPLVLIFEIQFDVFAEVFACGRRREKRQGQRKEGEHSNRCENAENPKGSAHLL